MRAIDAAVARRQRGHDERRSPRARSRPRRSPRSLSARRSSPTDPSRRSSTPTSASAPRRSPTANGHDAPRSPTDAVDGERRSLAARSRPRELAANAVAHGPHSGRLGHERRSSPAPSRRTSTFQQAGVRRRRRARSRTSSPATDSPLVTSPTTPGRRGWTSRTRSRCTADRRCKLGARRSSLNRRGYVDERADPVARWPGRGSMLRARCTVNDAGNANTRTFRGRISDNTTHYSSLMGAATLATGTGLPSVADGACDGRHSRLDDDGAGSRSQLLARQVAQVQLRRPLTAQASGQTATQIVCVRIA
jgi:hypothetical protein